MAEDGVWVSGEMMADELSTSLLGEVAMRKDGVMADCDMLLRADSLLQYGLGLAYERASVFVSTQMLLSGEANWRFTGSHKPVDAHGS